MVKRRRFWDIVLYTANSGVPAYVGHSTFNILYYIIIIEREPIYFDLHPGAG